MSIHGHQHWSTPPLEPTSTSALLRASTSTSLTSSTLPPTQTSLPTLHYHQHSHQHKHQLALPSHCFHIAFGVAMALRWHCFAIAFSNALALLCCFCTALALVRLCPCVALAQQWSHYCIAFAFASALLRKCWLPWCIFFDWSFKLQLKKMAQE